MALFRHMVSNTTIWDQHPLHRRITSIPQIIPAVRDSEIVIHSIVKDARVIGRAFPTHAQIRKAPVRINSTHHVLGSEAFPGNPCQYLVRAHTCGKELPIYCAEAILEVGIPFLGPPDSGLDFRIGLFDEDSRQLVAMGTARGTRRLAERLAG